MEDEESAAPRYGRPNDRVDQSDLLVQQTELECAHALVITTLIAAREAPAQLRRSRPTR